MRHYYINKEWIVSDTAKQIYRFAALVSIAFFLLLIWIITAERLPSFMETVYRPLLFIGVLGTTTTVVAMEYFLFGFDPNPAWKKTLWFFVLCLPPIGPAIYCLTVYAKCDPAQCGKSQRIEDIIH